jgi:hypothetical protein
MSAMGLGARHSLASSESGTEQLGQVLAVEWAAAL